MSSQARQRPVIDRYTLTTVAVVAGVLLIVPAIIYVYVEGLLDPLLLIAGILAVVMALRLLKTQERNAKGIVLLLLSAAMLTVYRSPTGRESRIPISMVLALALVGSWLFSMLFSKPP